MLIYEKIMLDVIPGMGFPGGFFSGFLFRLSEQFINQPVL